jgi:death-on-curing protein
MIDSNTAGRIHNILIDEYGGAKGIRDLKGLESALARPFATFDGVDLYPTPIDKAAALFESLIIAHPFLDGNKRVSYVLMRLLLLEHRIDIYATQDEKFNFVIAASTGRNRFKEIREWLSLHAKDRNEP